MKIVAVSNFSNEATKEILIAENVHKNYINEIINFLNSKYGSEHSPYYIVAKEDDYVLWQGKEEFI